MPRSALLIHRALQEQRKFISSGPYVRDSTQRFGILFPCFYCVYISRSEGGRTRHILFSPRCRQAYDKQSKAESLSDAHGDPRMVRVPEPEFNEPDPPRSVRRAKPPTESPVRSRPGSPLVFPPPAHLPPSPLDNGALEYDEKRQVFVERYPDPRAGAPINDGTTAPIDLEAYMANSGNLGNPDYFDTAELLMTTGLTNGGRDAHLKSRLVSSLLFKREGTYE
jgi:hypothetical protein